MRGLLGGGLVVLAFVVSWAICLGIRRVAPGLGFVDEPGGRKAHKAPTPLGGGLALWATTVLVVVGAVLILISVDGIGFSLPTELERHVRGARSRLPELFGILGLATIIMVMGLIDDRVGLGW